jgi:hypothetical protein
VSGLKRVGNYVAAAFKLGRTERLAKSANRSVQDHEVRLAEVEVRLAEVTDKNAVGARRLSNSIKQMVTGETQALMARNAELARNYMDLSRRAHAADTTDASNRGAA